MSPFEGSGDVSCTPSLVAGTHNAILVTPENVVLQVIPGILNSELGPRAPWSIPPWLDPQVPASV